MWYILQDWLATNWWIVLLILAAAYIARHFSSAVVRVLVRRTITHRSHGDYDTGDIKKRQDTLIIMFSAIAKVIIWSIALFSILGLFGLDLAPLLASASILGVAIGFGAQSLIKDFLSGLFIILENQYRVGDVVELDGATGKVEEIGLRSTVLRDNDGSVHYIPNGTIQHTINRTMGHARLNLTITVAPTTDVDKLTDVVNHVGTQMLSEEKWKHKLIEAPYFLNVSNFSNTSMEVKVAGKMQSAAQWNISGELRKRLLAAFNKEGIGLTAPITPPAKKK